MVQAPGIPTHPTTGETARTPVRVASSPRARRGIRTWRRIKQGWQLYAMLAWTSIYVWSGVWQHLGFNCVIFLAALASIDPTLHDAATVDGANTLQRIRDIDLPGIMPVVVIVLFLNLGFLLTTGFEKVLLLQNPLNLHTSEVIDTYVYRIGLQSAVPNFSYAAAIGLFKALTGLVLIVAANQLARRLKSASLW